jgi:hypothetical protein
MAGLIAERREVYNCAKIRLNLESLLQLLFPFVVDVPLYHLFS